MKKKYVFKGLSCTYFQHPGNRHEVIIFIHGGPGMNSGLLEKFIEEESLFHDLNYSIFSYDQRGCGLSFEKEIDKISHIVNIDDLMNIIDFVEKNLCLEISGIIGHSYGAKILSDLCKKFDIKIPFVFVSTGKSILIPRINNLICDLNLLKIYSSENYNAIFSEIKEINQESLWEITTRLFEKFNSIKSKESFYWANIDIMEKANKMKEKICKINEEIFVKIRKELYLLNSDFTIDFDKKISNYIIINGFHDISVNNADFFLNDLYKDKFFLFPKSSHYPHFEENSRFCDVVNKFIESTNK